LGRIDTIPQNTPRSIPINHIGMRFAPSSDQDR
jgi:hypothetical protein